MAPITDEERRWVVFGLCLTKVLTPALRKVLATEMPSWYNVLCQPPTKIDKQLCSGYKKTLSPSTLRLNYKNINNNHVSSPYDYAVKDPLSLAKLFVLPHMCNFTGFDHTMDPSAALSLISEAAPFTAASPHAKDVRINRNEWAHCNFAEWTEAKFGACYQNMETLLKKINLSSENKEIFCNELRSWKDKDFDSYFDQLNMELFTSVRSEVLELLKHPKSNDNEARLSRLISVQGRETQRKYFDSIHPPATLTTTLNDHRGTLETLLESGVITPAQMKVLFPPVEISSSSEYDVPLLVILLRNICGLYPLLLLDHGTRIPRQTTSVWRLTW
ncbi:uncharacterized protein LOC114530306 [Dendronephthya gigantea]|uniref:uncharacterized protein LOC114530306 n=1 Tax=Dendronephthya gigantea TaxID=151771 RepID=UPI00106BD787|nr:uncharacterized protein LOC114530306 [Dendronephthya gigantea]